MDDQPLRNLARILDDNETMNRLIDEALADEAKHAGREDLRTILVRIDHRLQCLMMELLKR